MKRYAMRGAALLTIFSITMPTWAQQIDPVCSRYSSMWSGGWHNGFLGPLMMILLLILAIVAIVFIVKWISGASHGEIRSHSGSDRNAAIEILKTRFARGEIDQEEFEEKRRVLES